MTMPESLDAPLAQLQSPRRSATLPAKLLAAKQPGSGASRTDGILYYHPSAKIVHFSPRALAPIPSSTAPSDFDYPVDTIETLPWRSPTERTVALGPLRLENVHGLTAFLKCGGVVHAILKNSQCWCVDGESTFVLRVRPLTYYRIEIPNEIEEDKASVAELKGALPKILRYEVTPCPFKRGFTVEIPEESKTPRRKRAWRPKGKRESAPARFADVSTSDTVKDDEPSDCRSPGEGPDGRATDGSAFTARCSSGTVLETIPDDNELSYVPVPKETGISRHSVTETQSFHTLLARFEPNTEPHVDDASLSSSVESFHSAQPSSPLLPPSSSQSDSTAPTSVEYTEHVESGYPVCESSAQSASAPDVAPSTNEPDPSYPHETIAPESSNDSTEHISTPRTNLPDATSTTPTSATTKPDTNISGMTAEFRRRNKASREREYSPMPPASILCRPGSDPSEEHSSASIIQKTCTLVLVPPVQLLLVLIHIAARIVIGSALHSALGDVRKREEPADDGEPVDDFGLPLAVEPSEHDQPQECAKPDPWDLD